MSASRQDRYEACIGWHPLIDKALDAIAALPNPPKITQVKEKFGGLRIYTSKVCSEADQIIREAEAEASVTCEFCGAIGELRGGGWLKTLCKSCDKKRNSR